MSIALLLSSTNNTTEKLNKGAKGIGLLLSKGTEMGESKMEDLKARAANFRARHHASIQKHKDADAQ